MTDYNSLWKYAHNMDDSITTNNNILMTAVDSKFKNEFSFLKTE